MSAIISEFLKEFHKHPLFSLGLAFITMGWIYFALGNFAWASDLEELKFDVYNIQVTMQRSSIDARINDLEQQIWDLEQKEKIDTLNQGEVARLGLLKRELSQKKRELSLVPKLKQKD